MPYLGDHDVLLGPTGAPPVVRYRLHDTRLYTSLDADSPDYGVSAGVSYMKVHKLTKSLPDSGADDNPKTCLPGRHQIAHPHGAMALTQTCSKHGADVRGRCRHPNPRDAPIERPSGGSVFHDRVKVP